MRPRSTVAGASPAPRRGARTALCLLLPAAASLGPPAAAAPEWSSLEVAEELHPVRQPFLGRWQVQTAEAMAGPGAPVWFRDTANDLDLRLRLSEWDPEPFPHDTRSRDQALTMALAGSTLGWQRALRQLMRESPEMSSAWAAGQSVLSPSVRVRGRPGGGARATVDEPSAGRADLAFAELDQAPPARGIAPKPTPSFRSGSAFTMIPIPDAGSLQGAQPAPAERLSPTVNSWVQVEHLLIDAARLQTRLREAPDRPRPQVQWTAMARQGLTPGWALVGEARGDQRALTPSALRLGVETRLPTDLPLVMRASAARLAADRAARAPAEDRIDLSLRAALGWRLPQDVRSWPLGQVPGAPGRPAQELRPTGPVRTAQLVRSPVERQLDGPVPPRPDEGVAAAAPP